MSEIKGQLLGIILLLIVFASVSVGIASVFNTAKTTMTEKATQVVDDTETLLSVEDNQSQSGN